MDEEQLLEENDHYKTCILELANHVEELEEYIEDIEYTLKKIKRWNINTTQ